MEEGGSRKSGFMELVSRMLTGRKKITEEEIHDFIEASEEEGLVNEDESEMIRSIFSLRTTVVREVMVPRTDMACVSVKSGADLQPATNMPAPNNATAPKIFKFNAFLTFPP